MSEKPKEDKQKQSQVKINNTKITENVDNEKKPIGIVTKPNESEGNKDVQEPAQTHIEEKNLDAPIICLSDNDETLLPIKNVRKRKSTGSTNNLEEEHLLLKRRKIKVAGAPKMPLTGYVRYMNGRRESMRKEHPTKTALEHTKMIAEEWGQLSEERKAPYIEAAAVEKKRYLEELQIFLKARPDVLASELAKNKPTRRTDNKTVLKEKPQPITVVKDNEKEKDITPSPPSQTALQTEDKSKQKRTPTPVTTYTNNCISIPTFAPTVPGEIPIFTNEFLEHNKVHDMELRTLRKSKADLEQQNAVLEKHVENMKFGVEKMTNENDELEEKNRLLEIYLSKLKQKLAQAFAGLPLPTEPNGATVENIDKYMNELYKMATTNTHGPACLNKAKDILRKLDLQIQL